MKIIDQIIPVTEAFISTCITARNKSSSESSVLTVNEFPNYFIVSSGPLFRESFLFTEASVISSDYYYKVYVVDLDCFCQAVPKPADFYLHIKITY